MSFMHLKKTIRFKMYKHVFTFKDMYEGNHYAAMTLKIQSVDRIFVFSSADKHQFVGRLKLLH